MTQEKEGQSSLGWRGDIKKLVSSESILSEEVVCKIILLAKAVDIRNLDKGEKPFLYSSGNWGPGYVNIKGLVGQEEIFKTLVRQLSLRTLASGTQFDFIAANATGGMIPGYQLREDLQKLTGKEIPYVYVRGSRKPGGHQELVTGIDDNPYTPAGAKALVIEELINFAQTTTNSAVGLREIGFAVDSAATILHYQNPEAIKSLAENHISVVQVTSLPKLLEVAETEGIFSPQAVSDYRTFLQDPLAWQTQRGLEPVQR